MKYVLVLLLSLLIVAGCNKSEEVSLPEATHSGANTFSCMVDGKPYINSRKATRAYPGGIDCALSLSNSVLYLSSGHFFSIKVPCNAPTGLFEMAGQYPYRGYYWNYDNGTAITGANEFRTDSVHKGSLTLTHYDGKTVAGTFCFDCANDAGQVIHITEGRFDITL
jgi:hypothetical protein